MMGSRSFHVGWIAATLLGQQLSRASGTSICSTITVAGVGDLDGTYEKDPFKLSDPFARSGGTTYYEIDEFSENYADASGWYIAVGGLVVYRTYDPARHPADITMEWVECDGTYIYCDDHAATLQPVITCSVDNNTLPPTPSPTRVETPSPSSPPTTGGTPTPTPSPMIPERDDDDSEPQSPSPPPTGADEEDDGGSGGSSVGSSNNSEDRVFELVIGVLSTLISAAMITAATYFCRRNRQSI